MRDFYTDFYHSFRCIANRCEDSCCKDWDIDVDGDSEAYYQNVPGALGDKIRALTVTDEYGERVFRSGNGRCPFWNSDMLCDIYIGLGEEHLSRTCANFPRVHIDYDEFREHILSFACPEAARMMLRTDEKAYRKFGGAEELAATDGRNDFMSFLLKARERTVGILLNRDEPFAYRLSDCLEFNAQVQSLLLGEDPRPLVFDDADNHSTAFVFDMHLGFEIMSKTWRELLEGAAQQADEWKIHGDFSQDFEKFALYYVYRYYLEAVNSGDVLYSIKRIVCAYIVTGKLDSMLSQDGYPFSRMRVLQRYSKEVEHSYENTERLNSTFDADERFTVENLITLLDGMVE